MIWRTMTASVVMTGLLAACLWAAEPAANMTSGKEPDKAVNRLVLPAAKVDNPEKKHFITKWLILGEFTFGENDFGGDPQTESVEKAFMPKEAELDGSQPAPKDMKWEEKTFGDSTTGGMPGQVDLGGTEHAADYAVAWVYCPEAIGDAKLLVGSDDYMKVWINGKLVHTFKTERRSSQADQDTVPGVSLNKGYNRVVVKCVNVVSAWAFYLRFADKDGKAFAVETE